MQFESPSRAALLRMPAGEFEVRYGLSPRNIQRYCRKAGRALASRMAAEQAAQYSAVLLRGKYAVHGRIPCGVFFDGFGLARRGTICYNKRQKNGEQTWKNRRRF